MAQERPDARSEGGVAELTEGPIEVGQVIRLVAGPAMGAIAVFVGTVREASRGRSVRYLEYEAYRPMAEKALLAIVRAMPLEFGPCRAAIVHRTGRCEIGDASVVIAVASPHRRTALAACREAIERLKKTVPIWKKEFFEGGAAWVEGEAPSGCCEEDHAGEGVHDEI
jgi:molybdopterin synthase catalytic subunit